MIRKTIHFSGTVQGVGFRYTTQHLARGFAVTGFVRNLPDGRVELVVEGKPDQIDGLVSAVQQSMGSCIRHVAGSESAATGEYRGFDVAF